MTSTAEVPAGCGRSATGSNGTSDAFAVQLNHKHRRGAVLGGKGAALERLIAGRHPVPQTGVVTTMAYEAVAAQNPAVGAMVESILGEPWEVADVDKLYAEVAVPAAVQEQVVAMARSVGGGGPVAVRSSATVEDLSGSSFAGQYRSLLNVDSSDESAVLDAVRSVWASLWHPAPTAYRAAFGVGSDDAAMAVVVMAMVPATTAGVIFTADPGGSNGARVEAVEGLGESLVSGERTPRAWIVPHDDSIPVKGADELPTEARRALDLSLQIAAEAGVPQDIEWAAVDHDVFIVQARPITVLDVGDGFDSPVDDHELTTAGIAEMVPGVQPPLRWAANRFLLEEAFRSVLDTLGLLTGDEAEAPHLIRRVRGRIVLDFDQLRLITARIPGAAAQLESEYFGTAIDDAFAREQEGNWIDGLRRDFRTTRARRKVVDDAAIVIQATTKLRDNRPAIDTKTDAELLAYRDRIIDLATRGMTGELGVAAAGGAAFQRLVALLDRHEGNGAEGARAVTARSGSFVERHPDSSAAVFGGPTWTELGLAPPKPVHEGARLEEAIEQLEGRLKALPGWRTRRILTGQIIDVRTTIVRRTVLETVEQFQRREQAKAAILELGGELRRVNTEIGRRLTDRQVTTSADEVELFSPSELAGSLLGGNPVGPDVLRRRERWLARYETEGELPIRFRGEPDRTPAPRPEGDTIEGWAASPGRARGVARVLHDPRESFEPGDILVAVSTDASWSPLFVRAGAVVVERGGPLSHAAILARELSLPAVLNAEGATRMLDGKVVTVDGDDGVVVIESGEAQS